MRYNILEKNKSEYGIDIYKPSSVKWNEFEFTNGFKKHIIVNDEILKPYLISYRYFGTVEYEDLILLVNGIDDIFTILPGTEIKIPFAEDIKNFILKYKK